jgi:NADH dehydrogenase FAD-containing subunit
MAEAEEDPSRHKELLTFVLVGAGPTGVEIASAIAVMVRSTLKREFRRIDPTSARIVLVDRGSRPLGTFAPNLSEAARQRLARLGVEVRLGKSVDTIDEQGVVVAGERIASKTVIWTAGVAPSPAGKWLNAETDRAGRVRVCSDLTVQNHPEIFVVGDTASLDQDGKPLPGVAQVAMQQGRFAGNLIASSSLEDLCLVHSATSIKETWQWSARASQFWKAVGCVLVVSRRGLSGSPSICSSSLSRVFG